MKNGQPGTKAETCYVVQVMQKADSNSSAGTTADSKQKVEDIFGSSHDTKPNVSGLPLSTPEIQSADIVSLILLCKLSDGTVRSVNTGRKEESKILDLLEKEYNTIPVSINCIKGVDIIVPS